MNYANSKIYKVQFDDGHFYIGSTATELRKRLYGHRDDRSKSACSQYMKQVGKDACSIVLIEDFPCENKQQLVRKEDEHIQLHRENALCLNSRRAFVSVEEHTENAKTYRETHREDCRAKKKEHYQAHKNEYKAHYEAHKEESKAYYQAHKEELKAKRRAYYQEKKNQSK